MIPSSVLQTNPGALCAKIIKIIKINKNRIPGALRSQVSGLSLSPLTLFSHSLLFITLREHGRSFIGGGGCPRFRRNFFSRDFSRFYTHQSPPSTFWLRCPTTTTQPAMERYARVSFHNVLSCLMASFFLVPLAKRCVPHQNPLNTLFRKMSK